MAARRYPAIPRGSIADDIQAITEILDIGLGIRGDPLDRFLTWQDLLDKGIAKVIPDKVRRNGITDDAIGDGNPPTEGPSTSEPDAPTGFTATGGIDSVILVWDNPRDIYDNHAYTEVWRHTSDDIGNAVLIGTSSGMSYIDHVGAIDETRYYWIRFMSKADVPGPFNSASGTSATTAGVVTGILDEAAVITSKLADASVDTNKLINLAVDAAKLADSAVTSTKIANLAVGNAAIANLAVGTAKIADLAVVNAKIADATITGAKIANATITGSLIASSTIVDANIVDSTITGAKLANATITGANIAGSTISGSNIAGATITGANISNSTITNAHINDLSADKINAGILTGRTIRTAASGRRAVIESSSNDIRFYNASGQVVVIVGDYSGVYGASSGYFGLNAPTAVGVTADGTTYGAVGTTTSIGGAAVNGEATYTGTAPTTAVRGRSRANNATAQGVYGISDYGRAVAGQGSTWAFYAITGGYGPFTGAHDAVIDKEDSITLGDIVVDGTLVGSWGVSDAMFEAVVSTASNQFALGVYAGRAAAPLISEESPSIPYPSLNNLTESEYNALCEDNDIAVVNGLGEGLINVCDYNGDISVGDLIVTCPVPGKGAKQADDIVRSYTVARARQAVTWASEPGTTKLIPCIYLSG